MKYAKLNKDGSLSYFITTLLNVEWDSTHFCPVNCLTSSELQYFNIAAVIETAPPVITEFQSVIPDGIEKIDGIYQLKWKVINLNTTETQIVKDNILKQVILNIKNKRNEVKFGGVLVDGKWIHSDTYSRTQWLGMVAKNSLGLAVSPIPWTSMDGTTIVTTIVLAQKVVMAVEMLDLRAYGHGFQLEALVKAAADPRTIDINQGWPAVYP